MRESHLVLGGVAEPLEIAIGGGTACCVSMAAPDDHGPCEDGALLLPLPGDRAVLAVADGVGGRAGGAEAAQLALQCVRDSIKAAPPEEPDLAAPILRAIEEAGDRIAALGVGAATTLIVVELNGPHLRTWVIGDSGALVVSSRGRVRFQTIMHSPVGYALEAGLLAEHEAIRHEDRHLVSNVLGERDVQTDVRSGLRLRPLDTLVIGTDGLLDNLLSEETAALVRVGPLARGAAALRDAAQRRMAAVDPAHPSKPDDLTFVLFRQRRGNAR